jgi:hypothetical protein
LPGSTATTVSQRTLRPQSTPPEPSSAPPPSCSSSDGRPLS